MSCSKEIGHFVLPVRRIPGNTSRIEHSCHPVKPAAHNLMPGRIVKSRPSDTTSYLTPYPCSLWYSRLHSYSPASRSAKTHRSHIPRGYAAPDSPPSTRRKSYSSAVPSPGAGLETDWTKSLMNSHTAPRSHCHYPGSRGSRAGPGAPAS